MEHFIEQSLVFIGAAIILVPIFKTLGYGSVLGYLVGGVIVGPHGLKFIHESHEVMHFAELGVALLLFMIGLEIQLPKLWSLRKRLFGMGGLQIGITMLVLTSIGIAVGLPQSTALIVGFSLSLSSTAFVMQTLTERNQLNTEYGQSSFSILLMQDLAAIPALAIIPALIGAGDKDTSAWMSFLQFVVIVVGLSFASRYAMKYIFRLITATRMREIFTGTALFIVLGVAFMMEAIGLSAALGTFIAGVLLAESEYRHELEATLEPFKSLLMGLFFMSVGMSVNLDLIVQKPASIISIATGYLFIKGVIIYGISRLFQSNHENSKLTALQIAQGGEFAFVILGMVNTFGIIPTETNDLLNSVILLSMGINPILSRIHEYAYQQQKRQSTQEPSYDKIENETPQVIVAGLGRFGQVFGRIMRAQGIPYVAIDHDSGQIDLLRKFGAKVYFGDASRVDLLESAGASKAKYFILAVDNVDTSVKIAKTVKQNFPNLTIYARARNRGHVFDLLDLGVKNIKRELFDSGINFMEELLIDMGFEKNVAHRIIERFAEHDRTMIEEQQKVRNDDQKFVSVAKRGVELLEKVLREETQQSYIKPRK